MAKIVQFQFNAPPEKFGLQPVRKRKTDNPRKPGQLDLFTGGKILKLNQLSPFDEALLFDQQGDRAIARQQYQKAIDAQDSVADAYCNLGIIESQDGNYPKAIDCFTKALKEDPRHNVAHYNLANLYSEVGNYPLARIHYEIAIELEPEFANSYFNLGLTLANLKEYSKAIELFNAYKLHAPDEEHQQTNELIFKLSGLSN
jgi:tetratricopeptide (TPR) repeat protein